MGPGDARRQQLSMLVPVAYQQYHLSDDCGGIWDGFAIAC
jgi:hypothetical protein